MSHSQHLKYRKPATRQPCLHPSCHSVAARGRPWCMTHPSCPPPPPPPWKLPTFALHSDPQALQASPPKPASPSQAVISQAFPVDWGQQGTPKPLPALNWHAGTQNTPQGTFPHPGGRPEPRRGLTPYDTGSVCQDTSTGQQALCSLIRGAQHTPDGPEVPRSSRADQSPVLSGSSLELFPVDTTVEEGGQEVAGAMRDNTARNTVSATSEKQCKTTKVGVSHSELTFPVMGL